MAAPEYVPVPLADRARKGEVLPPARRWTATRPADLVGSQPTGYLLGKPGPDQGYGLALAQRFAGTLQLATGETEADAIAGCTAVALRRASMFGRAPVIYDCDLAFTLWGYLGDAPDDLVAFRRPLFAGAAHHYRQQREIADRVPEASLRLTAAEARTRLAEWRTLLGASSG
jgi:hypothetical protein